MHDGICSLTKRWKQPTSSAQRENAQRAVHLQSNRKRRPARGTVVKDDPVGRVQSCILDDFRLARAQLPTGQRGQRRIEANPAQPDSARKECTHGIVGRTVSDLI